MILWWVIFFSDLLVPLVMIIAGAIMQRRPPKDINCLLGYRTTRSMKNMDTWRFAHEHCGRLWWRVGLVMLALSAISHIPFYNSDEATLTVLELVVMTIECIALIVSIFPTEAALKRVFDENGNRK